MEQEAHNEVPTIVIPLTVDETQCDIKSIFGFGSITIDSLSDNNGDDVMLLI